MQKYRDSIAGAMVICFAAAIFAASFHIRQFTITSLGAEFMPRLTAGFMAVLGGILLFRDLGKHLFSSVAASAAAATPDARPEPHGDHKNAPPPAGKIAGRWAVVLNIALFSSYLLALEQIGFIIATSVYLFFQIELLAARNRRRWVVFAVLSVAVSVVSYYVFTTFFRVMLPPGLLA